MTPTWLLNTEGIARLVRFGGVGCLCTLGYVGVMGLLSWAALLPTLANHVLAFSAGVPVSYILQKQFTFRHTGSHRYSLPRFVVANGAAFLASSLSVVVTKDFFGFREFAVIAIVLVVVPTISFLAMALWVFIDPNVPSAGAPQL